MCETWHRRAADVLQLTLRSIGQYAVRFQREFSGYLAPIAVPTITAAILIADERGYRPREALFEDLLQQLPWQMPPDVVCLHTHWETWFPASSVARAGLKETLAVLHAQGIRLGIVTNGVVRRQQPKKPEPRIFARALAEVDCQAPQAWFVGDHPINDVLGAAAVGLQPIWLCGIHPWPSDHAAPSWQIEALPEVVELVQQERNTAT